jgi:hypothetical protein
MRVTEILQEIKPYVLGWIETGGEEGGYAPSPHEMDGAHHIGTLTSSQYPDALLRDGSRSLTGNLSVGAGITIDGVDLGAFYSAYSTHISLPNAHHDAVTAGDGIDVTGQQVAVDVTDFIDTSYGLTEDTNNIRVSLQTSGGLDFYTGAIGVDASDFAGTGLEDDGSENLRIAAAAAGNGLTGGGGSALAVGAGTLITVGADTVGITAGANYQFIGTGSGTAAAWQNLSDLAGAGLTHTTGVLAVGAGDGIDVGADTVDVDVTDFIDTSYGLTEDTNNIRVNLDANGGLEFNSGAIRVKLATNHGLSRSSSGMALGTPTTLTSVTTDSVTTTTHAHSIAHAAPTVALTVSSVAAEGAATSFAPSGHIHAIATSDNPGANAYILASSALGYLTLVRLNTDTIADKSGGDLTISPAGDLKFNPTGAQIRVMASHTLQSDNFASQTTGWGISYAGGADFRYVYTDELHAKAFIADLEQALAGGQIITKSVSVVAADFTVPAASAAGTLWVEDLPGAPDMAVFQTGDMVRLRQFSRAAGSLTIADCWGVVTSYADGSGANAGLQSWTFTRSAAPNAGAATAGTTIAARSLALDYGTTGNGFYEVSAVDGAWAENSPYAQIVTWVTHPHSGKTVRTRLGNLKGITATTEYGLFAGEGVTAGDSYMRLSDVNFELHNLDFAMYDSGNVQRIGMDAGAGATDKLMWAGVSATDPRFIVYGDGTTWLSTLAISENMGDLLFSQADGLLLLGPGCAITPTSWTSTRGQAATISGAFHQVAGPWAQSRALMVEVAGVNYELAPRMIEDGTTGLAAGWSYSDNLGSGGNASYDVVVHPSGERGWMQRLYYTATAGDASDYVRLSDRVATGTFALNDYVTLSLDIRGELTGCSIRLYITEYDSGLVAGTEHISDPLVLTQTLQRMSYTAQMVDADCDHVVVRVEIYGIDDTNTFDVYFGAVNVEKRACATSFMAGSLPWCAWAGTADDSGTTRAVTEVNLDAYANLISANDTHSFSVWVQAPYDADATWPRGSGYNYVMSVYTDSSNNENLSYDETDDKWTLVVDGTERFQSSAQTFTAGDWIHLVLVIDYTNDTYTLYVNGVADGSATPVLSASAFSQWNLGSAYNAIYQGGFAFAEYAAFDRVLTAEEVAGMYASARPLADMGSLKRPGVYILDGDFSLRSSYTGARVQIDVSGVAGYSAATTQTFSLQTDGDLFAGSNIAAAATTAFAVFANAQTYGTASESMGAGDVLLGDNSAGKANVLWDQSVGRLLFRGGTTTQAYVDTDGSIIAGGGNVSIDADGIVVSSDLTAWSWSTAKSIRWLNGTEKISSILAYTDAVYGRHTTIDTYDESANKINHTILRAGKYPAGQYAYIDVIGDNVSSNSVIFFYTPGTTTEIYDGGTYSSRYLFVDSQIRVKNGISIGGNYRDVDNYAISIDDSPSTPTAPSSSTWMHVYFNDSKLVFQYYDGGTVRYKYLDLSGTGVTWVHTTTAP